MKKLAGFKGVFIVLILAALIIMYFRHLSNISTGNEEESEEVKVSVVTETLSRNMKTNYPATPKEVVKYFSEITKCFYNEEYTDEELEALADRMLCLYDDELASYKTHEDYLLDLRSDISFYKVNGYTISSYAPSQSTDVEYFSEDGCDWARLWCLYNIKSGKNYKQIQEVFILRKDEKNHWRIYGWRQVEDEA